MAVQPDLAQQQWSFTSDVLQSGKVSLQAFPRLQVDVEREQIEKRQLEVFGCGVVDVRDETVGILFLDRAVDTLDVALDRFAANPADQGGRDFVTDCIS